MNLNNFEPFIEDKIISRGHSYFENGQIADLEEIEDKEFIATVLGSEMYTVSIQLNEEFDILKCSCSCPYDWGVFCKHLVAVLYEIKASGAHLKKPEKPGNFRLIKKELEQYNKEELLKLFFEIMKADANFKSILLEYLGFEEDFY